MDTFGATDMIHIEDPTEQFQPNIRKTRKKGPSGHVAAGRKWETSEKGRIWKAQTVKAKHDLHEIIKRRTGFDVFANQRMTLKYAGLIRDGKSAEAKRIVEKVIANAMQVAKKESAKSPKRVQTRPQTRQPKENTASPAFPTTQPIPATQPKIQPIGAFPAILPNPAEKGIPQIQPQQQPLEMDRVDLPDFLE